MEQRKALKVQAHCAQQPTGNKLDTLDLGTPHYKGQNGVIIERVHYKCILVHAGNKCYEAKIEESEKAGSCQESNPGHLNQYNYPVCLPDITSPCHMLPFLLRLIFAY